MQIQGTFPVQDEDPEHESAATKSLKEQISQLDAERKELVKEGDSLGKSTDFWVEYDGEWWWNSGYMVVKWWLDDVKCWEWMRMVILFSSYQWLISSWRRRTLPHGFAMHDTMHWYASWSIARPRRKYQHLIFSYFLGHQIAGSADLLCVLVLRC